MELAPKKKYKNPYEEISNDEDNDDNNDNINTNIKNDSDTITLNIKKLDGTNFDVKIIKSSTIIELKQKIFNEHNIQVIRQRLIYKAKELKIDTDLLSKYGIVEDTTLHIVIRPLDTIPPPNNNDNVVVNMPPEGGFNPNPYFGGVRGEIVNNNPNNGNNANNVNNVNNVNPIVLDPELYRIWRLCRFIKIFALIDAIFLLLEGSAYPNFYFLIIFAICGYWGAKRLNRPCLILYVICLLLEIIFTIQIMSTSNALSVILMIIMIFIRMFVSKSVIELYRIIPHLTEQQRNILTARNRSGLF